MVRADPDIIMVGEIRDRETAQIAVESALTGHLVLSTLHTNDAPSAITRLIEMGIEPFLVASALDCVVAQRLARMLCPNCKRRTIISAEGPARERLQRRAWSSRPTSPSAAARCGGSGYRGRVGMYEVMKMSPEIQTLALERQPGRGDPRRGRPPGDDAPARRRPAEGPPGPHLDRRDRARHRHRLSSYLRPAPATGCVQGR